MPGVLHSRMDAWAGQVAIDEAYMDTWDIPDEEVSGQFESACARLNEAFDAFDEQLQERQDLLCVAAETPLLNNWRSLLHPAYGKCLPWWLDGTLEAVAKQIEESAPATQPSDVAWRKLVSSHSDSTTITEEMISSDPLQEKLEKLSEAFRWQFRPEATLATAAASGEKREARVLLDSKQGSVRMVVYQERDGDLRLAFSSTNDGDENQTFVVVVKEQTRPTVTFRRDPQTGELFGEVQIARDDLPEADLSKLTFRLKKP